MDLQRDDEKSPSSAPVAQRTTGPIVGPRPLLPAPTYTSGGSARQMEPNIAMEVYGNFVDGASDGPRSPSPPPEPGQAPPRKPPSAEAAFTLAQTLASAEVLGRDKPQVIVQALRGKDPATIAEALRELARRKGIADPDAETWVIRTLGADSPSAYEVQLRLSGERAEADAAQLKQALTDKNVLGKRDAKAIDATLESLARSEDREETLRRFAEQHPDKSVEELLAEAFPDEKERAKRLALLRGQTGSAKAYDLLEASEAGTLSKAWGSLVGFVKGDDPRKKEIVDTMRSVKPAELEQMLDTFAEGKGLGSASADEKKAKFLEQMKKTLGEGPEYDVVVARLQGDARGERVAALELARRRKDPGAFAREMEMPGNLSPEEQAEWLARKKEEQALDEAAWAERYGKKGAEGELVGSAGDQFHDAMVETAGGVDSAELTRLLAAQSQGGMTSADAVRYAAAKKDPAILRQVVSGLSVNEIEALESETGVSLVHLAADLASGRAERDLRLDIEHGKPGTAEASIDKELARAKGEESGVFGRLGNFISGHAADAGRMKARLRELQERAASVGLTDEERAEALASARHLQGATDLARRDEDIAADAMGKGAALVTGWFGGGPILKVAAAELAKLGTKGLNDLTREDAKKAGLALLNAAIKPIAKQGAADFTDNEVAREMVVAGQQAGVKELGEKGDVGDRARRMTAGVLAKGAEKHVKLGAEELGYGETVQDMAGAAAGSLVKSVNKPGDAAKALGKAVVKQATGGASEVAEPFLEPKDASSPKSRAPLLPRSAASPPQPTEAQPSLPTSAHDDGAALPTLSQLLGLDLPTLEQFLAEQPQHEFVTVGAGEAGPQR